ALRELAERRIPDDLNWKALVRKGNEYRGDDAAGRLVARQMNGDLPVDVEVRECSGESATLIETWQGFDRVYLVDAVESRQPPGSIHRLVAHEKEMPREFFHTSTHTSTHAFSLAFSLAEAIELARALDQLPEQVFVYGIEGQWFESGQKLTPAVKEAIPQVAQQIIAELKKG
ncbi:MAG: hydrogenase maturation protease, partial [Limisphaerales bacterium]